MTIQELSASYESVANTLKDRILALIPDHPEILEMKAASKLFRIPEFKCSDLEPSMAQAMWAFEQAKHEWEK